MQRWEGKVAIVTGASAGIGAAIVEEFVKNGLRVVGLARRVERIEELKKRLKGEKGELYPLKADVGNEKDAEKVFEFVKKNFGTVHVLVNNAGMSRNGNITDGNLEDFLEIINVNLIGLISFTQKALKLMKESGVSDGHIININSVAGHYIPQREGEHLTVYSASKHAVRALTEGIRHELRDFKLNTKITSISPGVVETEIMQALFDGTRGLKPSAEIMQAAKNAPRLQAKDVADAAVYVLQTPPHVLVSELMIRPVGEPF